MFVCLALFVCSSPCTHVVIRPRVFLGEKGPSLADRGGVVEVLAASGLQPAAGVSFDWALKKNFGEA